MSDDETPNEAGDNVIFLDMNPPRRKKKPGGGSGGSGGGDEPPKPPVEPSGEKRRRIPVLPKMDVLAEDIDLSDGVTRRDRAVVNMRITGASFAKIAEVLEIRGGAVEAKKILYSTLAKTHPEEDWDTLRQLTVARADRLLEQAMEMAAATHFVDMEDPDHLIPNDDQIRWAGIAQSALALHTTITGTRAPVKMELTPSDQEYGQIVQKLLEIEGKAPPKEFDILDAEIVEDEEDDSP